MLRFFTSTISFSSSIVSTGCQMAHEKKPSRTEILLQKQNFLFSKLTGSSVFLFAPNFLSRTRPTALACCVPRHLGKKKYCRVFTRGLRFAGAAVKSDRSATETQLVGANQLNKRIAPPSLLERRHNVQETGQPAKFVPGTNQRPHCACACA